MTIKADVSQHPQKRSVSPENLVVLMIDVLISKLTRRDYKKNSLNTKNKQKTKGLSVRENDLPFSTRQSAS